MTAPLQAMIADHPELAPLASDLATAVEAIAVSQRQGGCLYLCGNGGSMADALHISAELLKSFILPRPLDDGLRQRLVQAGPDGALLGETLQQGLRAVVLGLNHSLNSALGNDVIDCPAIGYAQELLALARPGDVLLGISTSGNARNVCYAAQIARARGLAVIALTGATGGQLAPLADVALCAPAARVERVQELHVCLYHCLCEMLEVRFFGQ
jgi:D-sedoheptulose 7-phosphate isomerase